ncbi:conserved hypothetical protein [Coccidioides posadasii str. Silveira]|uniref:Uncharacterized protein n=1 Tax=Coccidioides posadasii (strain RMSCC 757 / Silveira) TaxID=443226 RepID=E9CVD8_COCPS|nr:conserved hypothetical protein [Coccidioides posadasii str. Silveira]
MLNLNSTALSSGMPDANIGAHLPQEPLTLTANMFTPTALARHPTPPRRLCPRIIPVPGGDHPPANSDGGDTCKTTND